MIFRDHLYTRILIEPYRNGADELLILSGYATAPLAYRHMDEILAVRPGARIRLYVGMCASDGIARSNHTNFKRLSVDERPLNFSCHYTRNPIHAKIFVWLVNGVPQFAFTGSANYTQNAFSNAVQVEAMTPTEPQASRDLINALIADAVDCRAPDVDTLFNIYDPEEAVEIRSRVHPPEEAQVGSAAEPPLHPYHQFENVTVSLLDGSGTLPIRSGLNWGQRPGREPNQAYLRLTADIYNSDFFPPVGIRFTLLTDDDQSFICTRAQQRGKAIETPQNNSYLGQYFRQRLGLPIGSLVTTQHLTDYGRHEIAFYKIDEETYFMDFSV